MADECAEPYHGVGGSIFDWVMMTSPEVYARTVLIYFANILNFVCICFSLSYCTQYDPLLSICCCYRMRRFATMQRVTDRHTDDIVMTDCHHNVVCMSVYPSVTLCIVAKRGILQQKCLNQ